MASSLPLDLPRSRPRLVRMIVADAGNGMIKFRCRRCAHDTGWIADRWTVTEGNRGLPCPVCNKEAPADGA